MFSSHSLLSSNHYSHDQTATHPSFVLSLFRIFQLAFPGHRGSDELLGELPPSVAALVLGWWSDEAGLGNAGVGGTPTPPLPFPPLPHLSPPVTTLPPHPTSHLSHLPLPHPNTHPFSDPPSLFTNLFPTLYINPPSSPLPPYPTPPPPPTNHTSLPPLTSHLSHTPSLHPIP